MDSQLTPREIQARIRAGRAVDEVAAAAGIPIARVERFAAPVQAEREHVAEQARLAPARRASGGSAPRLGELVEARFAEQKVLADSVAWDAWRGDEARWTVHLSYRTGTRERVARWSYDPRGRVLAAANEEARWLVDEAAPDRPKTDGSETDQAEDAGRSPMRRLSSVPVASGDGGTAPDEVYDREVYDREADEQPEGAAVDPSAEAAVGQSHPHDGPAPGDQQPVRRGARGAQGGRGSRGGGRPSVPSWDDIMFGARKPD